MAINDYRYQPEDDAAPEEEPGLLSQAGSAAWNYGLHPLLTLLDTPGRFVRTALHTGDLGKAGSAIINPDEGSSAEDLLRDAGYRTTEAGDNRSWGTAVQDFIASAGVGALTDPLTYLGIGELTQAGEATKSFGMQAARALAHGDAKIGVEAGIEGAGTLARWLHGELSVAEGRLGSGLMKPGLLPEGADEAMKAAHFEHLQDYLSTFGMGKTFRERLKLGQQSILGLGNPFGSTKSGLLGQASPEALEAGAAAFKPGTTTGELWNDYLAGGSKTYRPNEVTPISEALAKAQGNKFADWLGNTADSVSEVARRTAVGRGITDTLASARDFFFNPIDKDALDEIRRVAPTLNNEQLSYLNGQVAQFAKNLDEIGLSLEDRQAITELAMQRNVKDEGVQLRTAMITGDLQSRLTPDQMAKVHESVQNVRDVSEKLLAFRDKNGQATRLGDVWRQLDGEMRKYLDSAEALQADRLRAQQEMNAASQGLRANEHGLMQGAEQRNAEAMLSYGEQSAKREREAGLVQARKDFVERVNKLDATPEVKGRIQTAADRLAASYGEANEVSHNHWFLEKAGTLEDGELHELAGGLERSQARDAAAQEADRQAAEEAGKVLGLNPQDTARFYAKGWTKDDLLKLNADDAKGMLKEGIADFRKARGKIGNLTADELREQPREIVGAFGATLDKEQRQAWQEMVSSAVTKDATDDSLKRLYNIEDLKPFRDALSEEEQTALSKVVLKFEPNKEGEIPFGKIYKKLDAEQRAVLQKFEDFTGKQGATKAGDVEQGLLNQYKDFVNERFGREGKRPAKNIPASAVDAGVNPKAALDLHAQAGQHGAEEGNFARVLRRSLKDDDRAAIDNWLGSEGHLHTSLRDAAKTGDDVAMNNAAAAEVRFETAWAHYKLTGEAPSEGTQQAFERMAQMEDNIASGSVKPKPLTKIPPSVPKPKLEQTGFTDARGIARPYLLTLDEYKDQVAKSGSLHITEGKGGTSVGRVGSKASDGSIAKYASASPLDEPLRPINPNLKSLDEAHAQALTKAIGDGYYVPQHVLESRNDLRFAANSPLWHQNEANLGRLNPEQTLSIPENIQKARLELQKATRKYDAASTAANKYDVDGIKKFVDELQKTVQAIPEHMQLYLTPESARMLVKENLLGRGKLNNASLERGFLEAGGRPLSPAEINEMVKEGPEKIARMVSMAGRAPEADLSLKDLLSVYRNEPPALEGIAKATGKTVEDVARMPYTEKLKYLAQSYGKIFDERPDVLLAANLQSAARAVSKEDTLNGVLNLFARKAPVFEEKLAEGVAERRSELLQQLKEMRAQPFSPETKDKIKALENTYQMEHRGLPPGYVPAEMLTDSPRAAGMMLKKEVYERAVNQLTALDDPSWAKGFLKTLSGATSFWKTLQVGTWPGSWFRDMLGNQFLRFQAGGFHPETVGEINTLRKILTSDGNAEELAKLSLKVGGKEVNGLEFWKDAMREGVFSHNQVTHELGESLRGRLERGATSTAINKVRDKVNDFHSALLNSTRLEMFHSRMALGDSAAAAGAAVDSALFNYGRVSPFVDLARKTGIFPFATWASKNIPRQLEMLYTRPGQFTALLHAKNAIEHGIPGVDEADLPAYLHDKWNIVTRKDAQGNLGFLTLTDFIPMADLPNVAHPAQYMTQMLGPIPKTIMEQAMNRDSYTQKSIEDFDGQYDLVRLPGNSDFSLLARDKNILKNVVGRPLTVAEQAADLTDERVDPRLGRPRTFFERKSILSGLTGLSYQEAQADSLLQDKQNQAKRLEGEARKAEELAQRWRQRGQVSMAQKALAQAEDFRKQKAGVLKRAASLAR